MSKKLSDKIRVASLLCTFMVVVRHSSNLIAFFGGYVQNTCGYWEYGTSVMTEIAVPYFFLISGFFFFRTNFYERHHYLDMLLKKGRTLMAPYLLWNLLWAIPLYVVGLMDFNEPIIQKLWNLLMSEYDGALWYVRNLIIMMFFVPLYGWIFAIDNKWLYAIVTFGLLWWWLPVDCGWWAIEGWLFFFIGGLVQRYRGLMEWRMPEWGIIVLTMIWYYFAFEHPWWCITMNKITTLLGLFVFWQLLNLLQDGAFKWLLNMTSMNFFVYVNHLWVVKGMKVLLAKYYSQNETVAIAAYFVLPIITFFLLLWTGRLWQRLSPKSFNVVTGGRG